jgi:hypothetical protein
MVVFRFPNPVNEVAARVVAGGVLVMAVAFLSPAKAGSWSRSPTGSWHAF